MFYEDFLAIIFSFIYRKYLQQSSLGKDVTYIFVSNKKWAIKVQKLFHKKLPRNIFLVKLLSIS